MINWRTFQSYFLLFAFAFKILVLGTMLTLATHNICLGQLLNDDVNWVRLVGKQRKRNDNPSRSILSIHTGVTQHVTEPGNQLDKALMLPVLLILWGIPLPSYARRFSYFNHLLRYMPDKIFIRYCSLIR